ncbi:hypothetical protein [Bartonella machadoae]|uniref:hypothetical protein n=1 Tax=Bartonella machadoae TaxID=2893471 RepID=UPI001F4C888C|nr:hypothetical protein [Bartonella machadoae]UNE53446.1 hypothetical protein LNM86_07085 [Bartonella machadoae]
MIFSSHKLLTIAFLFLTLICGLKNAHAEFFLTELSLSGLTLDEKYQRIKERLQVVEKRIKFIEKTFADLTLSQIRVSNIEHDKLIQEQRDLIDERLKLNLKMDDLAKEKGDLIYRAYRARAYEAGEYEKKLIKAKKYLKSQRSYELGVGDGEEYLKEEEINEMVKLYPYFILVCKIDESLLYTEIGDLLRKDFGWKKEDFSWAKDAIKLTDQEFIKGIKELMAVDFDVFEKKVMNSVRDMITRNPSGVRSVPLLCKITKKMHDIMLPNRRKNIINRIGSHIEEWFQKR